MRTLTHHIVPFFSISSFPTDHEHPIMMRMIDYAAVDLQLLPIAKKKLERHQMHAPVSTYNMYMRS